MDNVTLDQIRTGFADLTGLVEDAASLAVKGQSPQISAAEAMRLARAIEVRLTRARRCLRDIKALAAGQSPGGDGP